MSRFSSLLQHINDRLDVPQPAKSRILLEIATDLEDAYEVFREHGHSEEDATRLAQERFLLDDSTIAELENIYQPFFKKMLDRFSLQVQSRWQRVILVLTLLSIAALSGQVMLTHDFFSQASPFIWPVVGISITGIVLFFIKFFKLYLLKQHQRKILRKGVDALLYLGVLSLALGFVGYFYELLRYSINTVYPGGSLITVIVTVTDSPQRILDIYTCFVTSSTVMMASLLSTLFLALFWYVLNHKVARIEMAEAASLLAR